MKVSLIYNPISGAGRAEEIAKKAAALLSDKDYETTVVASSSLRLGESAEAVEHSDRVILVGGDGTLAGWLDWLAQNGKPVYMLPAGNESLFAREFEMTCEPGDFLQKFCSGSVSSHRYGTANGTPFFTMVSVGLDSEVIARIASYRIGPIGHIGYVVPSLISLLRHSAPLLTVTADDRTICESKRGMLIIANCKQYALKLNPIAEACTEDEWLYARFVPYCSILGLGSFLLRCAMRKPGSAMREPLIRARQFKIVSGGSHEYPVQADGEFVGNTPVIVKLAEKRIQVIGSPR